MQEAPVTKESGPASRTAVLVGQLRLAIEHGQLAPGQRLIEADLTREYGVSRGPLREAFASLASEGLLDVVPNRGAIVRRITRRDLSDTMVIREAIEGLAAALAARNIGVGDNHTQLARFVRGARLGKQKPAEDFLRENQTLHGMLVAFADNPQLSDLIDRMRLQAFPRRTAMSLNDPDYRLSSSHEHLVIVQAVLAGDENAARNAMQEHVIKARERLLDAMADDRPAVAARRG